MAELAKSLEAIFCDDARTAVAVIWEALAHGAELPEFVRGES